MGRRLWWGKRRDRRGGLWSPQCAPQQGSCYTGPAFVWHKADSPAAASCVLSWNSHYVAGIQFCPVMKLQTAGSSLVYVTQEGKPLSWILALENLPGLSARALSPVAFLNHLWAPCFLQESVPVLTLSPHPSIKSAMSTVQDLGQGCTYTDQIRFGTQRVFNPREHYFIFKNLAQKIFIGPYNILGGQHGTRFSLCPQGT